LLRDCVSPELMVKKLDDYLKIVEATEFLGISQNMLRKWADEGWIPVRVNPVNG